MFWAVLIVTIGCLIWAVWILYTKIPVKTKVNRSFLQLRLLAGYEFWATNPEIQMIAQSDETFMLIRREDEVPSQPTAQSLVTDEGGFIHHIPLMEIDNYTWWIVSDGIVLLTFSLDGQDVEITTRPIESRRNTEGIKAAGLIILGLIVFILVGPLRP